MASAESQGKTIALVITIVMFVGAAATAYYFYDKVDAADKKAAEAMKAKSAAEAEARKTVDQYGEIRTLVLADNQGPADHAKVKEALTGMLSNPNPTPPNRKNVGQRRSAFDSVKAALDTANTTVKSLDGEIAALMDANANLTRQLTSSSNIYNDKLEVVAQDLKKKSNEFTKVVDDDTRRLEEQNVRVQDALDRANKTTQELEQLRRDSEDKIDRLTKNNERLLLLMDMIMRRQSRNQETRFNTSDGEIVQVLSGGDEAYLNIGRNDGVGEGLTFGIYGVDRSGFTQSLPKANVEIIRILGDEQSLGRIINYNIADPVVPGDKIFNPVWDRGRKTGVAILGLVDLDGDGRQDNDEFKRVIERWGGRVDAEVDFKTMKPVGRITIETDWLIEGKIPEPAEAGQIEAADAAAVRTAIETAATQFRNEARQHSVRPVNVHNFLAFMGYTPYRKTQMAGEEEMVRNIRHKQSTRRIEPNPGDDAQSDVDLERVRRELDSSKKKAGGTDTPAGSTGKKDDEPAQKKSTTKKSSDDADL